MSITTRLRSFCRLKKGVPNETALTVGDRLKKLRGKVPQAEIAKSLGISPSAWSMYERNERIPRDELKVSIAKFFGTSVQDLFF